MAKPAGPVKSCHAEILTTSNRLANVEHLNLEAVGVHADPELGIEVNELLQTHAIRIFAIGDVLKRHQYTHVAEVEAEVAFQNAVLRRRRKIDYTNLPWATFLIPRSRQSEFPKAQAKADDREHLVFRVNYADIDRARIDGSTEGFAKVIASSSGKILARPSLRAGELGAATTRNGNRRGAGTGRSGQDHSDLSDLWPGDQQACRSVPRNSL